MRIESNMFDSLDIAVSGLKANRKYMDTITSNVVNAQTTDTGTGQPYRRLEAVFQAEEGDGIYGVGDVDIIQDQSAFKEIMKPGHPDADANGMVLMPNVSLPTELINLNMATRAYQASASLMKRYQKMVETSLGLLR